MRSGKKRRELSVKSPTKYACVFAQVEKHLSKLFDNMAKMQFDADEEERPAQSAVGVFSREEEYVPFSQACECTGQVQTALSLIHVSEIMVHNFCVISGMLN